MRKYISSIAALSAVLAFAAYIPNAQADPGRHFHAYHGQGHYAHFAHRGHGYWRDGRWIALGIGAAALAAGAAAYDRDCYWRDGYRYCD